MQSDREMILEIYAAFNSREIDVVLSRMDPDVDWPNGMEGGRVIGHNQVREYWQRQWAVMDPRVEPLRIESDKTGRTAVRVHQVVHDLRGNLLVDREVQHVYRIRNGLIERMDIDESPI